MSVFILDVFRRNLRADVHALGATSVELAAGGRICGRRNVPLEYDAVHLDRRVGHRHRREKRLCVRMHGIGEYLVFGTVFHHAAKIHDADIIAYMLHDGEVVGNENISQIHVALQISEQVYYLSLNRHVESRNRLVADNQTGI